MLAAILLVFGCYAQQGTRPEFEVASVKPAGDPRQPGSGQHRLGPQIYGNRADYFYMTLRQLVAEAYRVQPDLVDGADWIRDGRFDVLAKMPAGSRKEDAPLMLQSLLAERFQLALHRESRQETVSVLVVAQGGPKLSESPSAAQPQSNHPDGNAAAAVRKSEGVSASATMGTVATRATVDAANSSIRFEASRATMADLARFLMRFGVSDGRPVLDRTGLNGEYEIVLDIPVALISAAREGAVSGAGAEPRPADDAAEPGGGRVMRSLKSLGLELKKTKAPVEYLVIDHAEKQPTGN